MSWGIVASVGGAVISGMAAGDAADAQAGSAARTDETNRYIYNDQKALQEPFRQTGLNANNRLAYLMGLGTGSGGGMGGSGGSAMTYEQARNQLLPQYTKTTGGPDQYGNYPRTMEGVGASDMTDSPRTTSIDEAGLSAAIQAMMQGQGAQSAGDPNDPAFGSLMRDFSLADFEKDPGYQFRMDEGLKGVEGGAASRGGLLSGAALKAIQKYGQNFASNEFGNAWSRDSANKTNKSNRLLALVGVGTGATNQIQDAGSKYASSTAGVNSSIGDARAAESIAKGNAWSDAISGGYNTYQNNELMKMIRQPSGGQMQWYD